MKLFSALGELAYQPTAICSDDFLLDVKLTSPMAQASTPRSAGAIAVVLGPAFHRFADGEAFARLAVAVANDTVQRAKGRRTFPHANGGPWTRQSEDALTCSRLRSDPRGNRRDGLRLLQPSASPYRSGWRAAILSTRCGRGGRRAGFRPQYSRPAGHFEHPGFVQSLRGGVASGAPSTMRHSKRGCSGRRSSVACFH